MAKDLFVSALLDVYGACLSEKQQSLAAHYYNDDLSLAEIAENEGITRQAVSDLIKRAEAQLRALEEQYRYCETFLKLKELAAHARQGDTQKLDELYELIENL